MMKSVVAISAIALMTGCSSMGSFREQSMGYYQQGMNWVDNPQEENVDVIDDFGNSIGEVKLVLLQDGKKLTAQRLFSDLSQSIRCTVGEDTVFDIKKGQDMTSKTTLIPFESVNVSYCRLL